MYFIVGLMKMCNAWGLDLHHGGAGQGIRRAPMDPNIPLVLTVGCWVIPPYSTNYHKPQAMFPFYCPSSIDNPNMINPIII